MSPYAYHVPSDVSQESGLSHIALSILGEFGNPIFPVRFRKCGMLGTTVPKASVNEDGDLFSRKHDVDGHSFDSSVKSES